MFSCRTRGFCPSCHAKRLEEWGEWMRETLLLDVPHRQVVFTIPKRLRVFFKYKRRLLGDVCHLALRAVSRYFELVAGSALTPGVIAAVQTFGDRINLHPHLHFLVTEGGVDEAGVFHLIPRIDDARLEGLFAREVLAALVRKELLSPEWAELPPVEYLFNLLKEREGRPGDFCCIGTSDALWVACPRVHTFLDASQPLFYTPARWLDGTTEPTPRPRTGEAKKQILIEFFVIDREDFLIGRTNTCDLVMSQSTISGRHARIQKFGDHYEIADLQSTNGTFLNGIKIERKHLRSEDKVKFDQLEFQFIDPADVGRTMIRPSHEEIAETMARERVPVAASSVRTAVMNQGLPSKKWSLLGGVIVGLLLSFLVGLVGNAVMIYFSIQQGGFSAQNFGSLLKNIALRYPTPHIPQVWFKEDFSDWRNIVSLGLIALAAIVGGILVQAVGKRARAASALSFSLFYVIGAVLIQMIIVKFKVQALPAIYPSLGQSLAPWPNFALAVGLFFVVVLVLSFIGTLFVSRPKISA